jgi:hypothetical protein
MQTLNWTFAAKINKLSRHAEVVKVGRRFLSIFAASRQLLRGVLRLTPEVTACLNSSVAAPDGHVTDTSCVVTTRHSETASDPSPLMIVGSSIAPVRQSFERHRVRRRRADGTRRAAGGGAAAAAVTARRGAGRDVQPWPVAADGVAVDQILRTNADGVVAAGYVCTEQPHLAGAIAAGGDDDRAESAG